MIQHLSQPQVNFEPNFSSRYSMSSGGFFPTPPNDDSLKSGGRGSTGAASRVAKPKARKNPVKRPLSSYNYFFHSERQRILKDTPTRKEGKPRRSHGKIGFADLARMIASKWKALSKEDRVEYDEKAAADKQRYQREMEEWKKGQAKATSATSATAAAAAAAAATPATPASRPIEAKLQPQPGSFASLFGEQTRTGFMRQQSAFLRDTFDRNSPIAGSIGLDQKLPAAETNVEPYTLSEVFPGYPEAKQEMKQEMMQEMRQEMRQEAMRAAASQGESNQADGGHNSTLSPRISDLASQLDDESTQLFLSLFRPPK